MKGIPLSCDALRCFKELKTDEKFWNKSKILVYNFDDGGNFLTHPEIAWTGSRFQFDYLSKLPSGEGVVCVLPVSGSKPRAIKKQYIKFATAWRLAGDEHFLAGIDFNGKLHYNEARITYFPFVAAEISAMGFSHVSYEKYRVVNKFINGIRAQGASYIQFLEESMDMTEKIAGFLRVGKRAGWVLGVEKHIPYFSYAHTIPVRHVVFRDYLLHLKKKNPFQISGLRCYIGTKGLRGVSGDKNTHHYNAHRNTYVELKESDKSQIGICVGNLSGKVITTDLLNRIVRSLGTMSLDSPWWGTKPKQLDELRTYVAKVETKLRPITVAKAFKKINDLLWGGEVREGRVDRLLREHRERVAAMIGDDE